jgi:DNA-binding beta-propeller fold protein YncE
MVSAAFAAEGYKVVNKIKIGGTGGWDYLAVDPATQRVYASHASVVEVVDTKAGKVVGQITQLHGVHGIALAPELNKGFITNGQSKSVTVFD